MKNDNQPMNFNDALKLVANQDSARITNKTGQEVIGTIDECFGTEPIIVYVSSKNEAIQKQITKAVSDIIEKNKYIAVVTTAEKMISIGAKEWFGILLQNKDMLIMNMPPKSPFLLCKR